MPREKREAQQVKTDTEKTRDYNRPSGIRGMKVPRHKRYKNSGAAGRK